ncbi:hypothetical protein A5886_000131 [Enterococcus sp. 8G7_MSG3316]|uniref:Uncharacterized protein n=1 Tax=Candidatus Enterococcus testudinis TaxID=1834191 RepID=A0A242A223_9ENTE|nr:hypothetical protein [Enterococcus sp. 8G7_MSG3316]OTN75087.1 hypothetical protein A5886_000131 [Enterococcus sp. 8G7_MSG3316]
MEPFVSIDTRLTQILTGFVQWQGSVEEASMLMAQNQSIIAAMKDTQVHSPETVALARQVMMAYQDFLTQLKAQQQVIKQELARLNRPNNLVKTYLQQEEGAAFVEFDL